MKPKLATALEAELDAVRKDPAGSIGSGKKTYLPYEPNTGEGLVGARDAAVTERLAEARGDGDRVYRLAVLHLLGKRADAGVDPALIALIDDATLRPTAAYLLGRAGFKGYPERKRDDGAVRAALLAHVADDGTFEDPFRRKTFRVGDFALAAFVRVAGPARFTPPSGKVDEFIGYTLPSFTDGDRAALIEQAKKLP